MFVLVFWLDKGVDGFRIDAAPYLFEHADFQDAPPPDNVSRSYVQNQPETYDMIYQWRQVIDDYNKQNGGDTRVLMTEAYTPINSTMLYYGNETVDGAHFTFNFYLIINTTNNSTANQVVSLGNHDRHRVATRQGVENVDGYNMLITLLPGIANTYNGEEIGMEDGEVTWEEGQDSIACQSARENFQSTSRDFQRTPFHWDSTVNAGFSTANKTWLPKKKSVVKDVIKEGFSNAGGKQLNGKLPGITEMQGFLRKHRN
ncbi:maltase A1-like [Agrilus planipennis]|uniref:Maltase A1-like n=1 Tax=Agrilus planipennis TaxID=224129 RepID=A0A7F5R733_AGRPL|nr:maltase A1-like [Agrilus planipennis]